MILINSQGWFSGILSMDKMELDKSELQEY